MVPNPWLLLVVLNIVVYRVTRVITRDEFPLVRIPREWMVVRLYPEYADVETQSRYGAKHGRAARPHLGALGQSIAYLLCCDWCMSVWVAAATVWAVWSWSTPNWFTFGWLQAVGYGIVAAAFTGIMSQHDEH